MRFPLFEWIVVYTEVIQFDGLSSRTFAGRRSRIRSLGVRPSLVAKCLPTVRPWRKALGWAFWPQSFSGKPTFCPLTQRNALAGVPSGD
jgi:hypothetical protein